MSMPKLLRKVRPASDATPREIALLKAIQRIADLTEGNCERYVKKCDSIAVDALVEYERD